MPPDLAEHDETVVNTCDTWKCQSDVKDIDTQGNWDKNP